jgi:hypothetical protein
LTNITFSGNRASLGGGMFNYGYGGVSSPILTNVTFSGNQADGGGRMYNAGWSGESSPTLTDVTFSGNQAAWGGGMCNRSSIEGVSNPVLTHVTFSGNQADDGGGIYNDAQNSVSSPVPTNVTFSGNQAYDSGGGMYNYGENGESSPILTNCILWGNEADDDPQIGNYSVTLTVTYSLIQDGCPDGTTCGDGMIYTDPQFIAPIDASGAPTTTGNYRLQATSPAIDAGDPAICPDHDLDGLPRPNDGDGDGTAICDMGAYEAGSMVCGVGAANTYSFPHHSGVSIEITDLGDELDCLYVDEMGIDHPHATGTSGDSGIQTGRYWLIRGLKADKTDATGFTANLTLPHEGLNDPKVCRYTGAGYGWDCAATGSDSSTVWRYGVTSFSDWAVGQHVGPTVVGLRGFGARGGLWAGGLLIALGAVYTLLAQTAAQHLHPRPWSQ